MQLDWRQDKYASLIVEFENKTRCDPSWRDFYLWLDTIDGGGEFVANLLEALQEACRKFDPDKRKKPKWWIWDHFTWARSKYAKGFKEWRNSQQRPISLHTVIGDNMTLGGLVNAGDENTDSHKDHVSPRTDGQSLRDVRSEVRFDDVEAPDPQWLEPGRRALVYRSSWRQAAKRNHSALTACTEKEQSAFAVPLHVANLALARRRWWRLLVR